MKKPVAKPAKRGRPSTFTKEVGDNICERLAAGESLRAICRADGRKAHTVLKWKDDHPEFAAQYARAREDQADALADEAMEIADASVGGMTADVAAARLRWDARRWFASKLAPKRYGDKVTQEITGGDKPVQVQLAPWQEFAATLKG